MCSPQASPPAASSFGQRGWVPWRGWLAAPPPEPAVHANHANLPLSAGGSAGSAFHPPGPSSRLGTQPRGSQPQSAGVGIGGRTGHTRGAPGQAPAVAHPLQPGEQIYGRTAPPVALPQPPGAALGPQLQWFSIRVLETPVQPGPEAHRQQVHGQPSPSGHQASTPSASPCSYSAAPTQWQQPLRPLQRPVAESSASSASPASRPAPAYPGQDHCFSCRHCSRRFARPEELNVHLRTHAEERPYGCMSCLKRFFFSKNLRNHLRTHSGERPHGCPYCPKRFCERGQLKAHLRTHTGEKPYACSECPKRFSQRTNLQAHQRTHTGETPFQCPLCSRRFRQRSSVKPHLNSHNISGSTR